MLFQCRFSNPLINFETFNVEEGCFEKTHRWKGREGVERER